QASLQFRYYFCRDDHAQESGDPDYSDFSCAGYRVSAAGSRLWMATESSMKDEVAHARKVFHLGSTDQAWFFQTGWTVDKEPEFRKKLTQSGCREWVHFSDNILVCRLTI